MTNNVEELKKLASAVRGSSPQPEVKDYNKHDHTHCFNQKESPCGIKGVHRCCLCLEPSPQTEEWERLIRGAVETKSAIFHMYENGDGKAEMESLIQMLQSFVGDEIRKAEERAYSKGLKYAWKYENQDYYVLGRKETMDSILKEFEKHRDGFYEESEYNYAVSILEALKK